MAHFLKYEIGGVGFASPIEEVQEIVRPKAVQSDVAIGKNFAGFFELRDQRIPIYSLPAFLGIKSAARGEVITSRIGEHLIGFLVDKVHGIVESPGMIPLPDLVRPRDYLQSVVKDGETFLQVISFVKIMTVQRLAGVKKFLGA